MEARNLIGLPGRTLVISQVLDQDGWMLEKGSWFWLINATKLCRRAVRSFVL